MLGKAEKTGIMFVNVWAQQPANLVGIDIGSHEIKSIVLNKTQEGYHVTHHACIPIKKLSPNAPEQEHYDAILAGLRFLMRTLPNNMKNTAVAVSGSAVMTKRIYVNAALNEEEMEAEIEIEASNLIPYPLAEVSLDFEIIGKNKNTSSKKDVLLSVCRTEKIDFLVDLLEEVKLEAKIVDIEGYAIGRSAKLIFDQVPDGKNKIICMLDIGAKKNTFSIIDCGQTVMVREQDIGGNQLTQSIAMTYSKTDDEAEMAKMTGNLPDNYEFDLLNSFQTQLLQQIKRTLQMYATAHQHKQPDYIMLTGGTSYIKGLDRFLTNALEIKTLLANPFKSCLDADDDIKAQLEPYIGKYMVACGLALRRFSDQH